LQFCSAIVVVSFDATVFIFAPTRQAVESDLSETLSLPRCCYMGSRERVSHYRQLRGDRFRQRRSPS